MSRGATPRARPYLICLAVLPAAPFFRRTSKPNYKECSRKWKRLFAPSTPLATRPLIFGPMEVFIPYKSSRANPIFPCSARLDTTQRRNRFSYALEVEFRLLISQCFDGIFLRGLVRRIKRASQRPNDGNHGSTADPRPSHDHSKQRQLVGDALSRHNTDDHPQNYSGD